jgi:sporulation protein YlmC with PRC-barrel domain
MRSFKKEDVVGKTVIETSGVVKGKVRDVMFDLGGGVIFLVQGADGKDNQIDVSKVTGISEHVVVRSEPSNESGAPDYGTACKFCGAAKPAQERWCPSCGRSQI